MNIPEILLAGSLSILPWVGLWVIIFCSPLLCHLLELWVTEEPMTSSDVEDWLITHQYFRLLNLYVCVWCQAFWTTVGGALTYTLAFSTALWFPIYVLTFYPIVTFVLWKIKQLPGGNE